MASETKWTLEKTCLHLKEETNKIQADIKEDNIEMKIQIERLEKCSRRNNLLINGIHIMQNEETRELVKSLGAKLKVPIRDTDIIAIDRLPGRTQPPTIVVKFGCRDTKTEMIKAFRKLDGSTFNYKPSFPHLLWWTLD